MTCAPVRILVTEQMMLDLLSCCASLHQRTVVYRPKFESMDRRCGPRKKRPGGRRSQRRKAPEGNLGTAPPPPLSPPSPHPRGGDPPGLRQGLSLHLVGWTGRGTLKHGLDFSTPASAP